MTRGPGLALVSVVAIGAALAAAPAFADHDTTFKCLVGINKEFKTIQAAADDPLCLYVQIDAAVWREPVVIRHSLTLAGTSFRHGDTVITTTFRPPEGVSRPHTMVRLVGRKVRLKVKHIVFQGPSTGPELIGIRVEKDSRLTIRDSEFIDIAREPANGSGRFVAIHVGAALQPGEPGPQITYAEISHTRFVGAQKSAIVVEGEGTTAYIHENFISGRARVRAAGEAAPVGIVVKGGATAVVERNDVVNHRRAGGGGTGIRLDRAGPGVVVQYNNIDRANRGLVIAGTSGVTVFRNGMDGNGEGIVVGTGAPANDLVISRNRTDGGGLGIRLQATTGSVLLRNLARGNRRHGIDVRAGATGNSIRDNTASLSGGPGFVDATTGSDPTGTANTWRRNICTGNNGGGLQALPTTLCLPP